MRSRNIILFVSLFVLTALQSCDTRRPIYPEEGVWVVVNLDWCNLPSEPNGATVIFYPQTRSDEFGPTILKTNYTCDSTYLKRDNYAIIVFNETTSSLSNIAFKSTDAYQTIEACIRTATNYTNYGTITTGGEPADFAIDHYDDLEVSRYSVLEKKRYELFFTPELVTKNLQVTLNIKGIENLASGYIQYVTIDGMNYGVMLNSGEENGSQIDHYMAFSEKVSDGKLLESIGYLRGNFNCFGVTEDHDNEVNVHLKLRDESDYEMTIDATNLIYITDNNQFQLFLDLELELPYVEDTGQTGSGFEGVVDEWDDEERLEIPVVI